MTTLSEDVRGGEEVGVFVGHKENSVLDFRVEEFPNLPAEFLAEHGIKLPIDDFILLVAKHRRTG